MSVAEQRLQEMRERTGSLQNTQNDLTDKMSHYNFRVDRLRKKNLQALTDETQISYITRRSKNIQIDILVSFSISIAIFVFYKYLYFNPKV